MRGLLRSGKAVKLRARTEPIDDFGDAEIILKKMDRPFCPRKGCFPDTPDRDLRQPETLFPPPGWRLGARRWPASISSSRLDLTRVALPTIGTLFQNRSSRHRQRGQVAVSSQFRKLDSSVSKLQGRGA